MNSSGLCVSAADDAFGPQVQHCRGGHDFTLLFEQAILTIIPATALLVAVPFRVLHLLRQPVVLSGKFLPTLQLIKLVWEPPHAW